MDNIRFEEEIQLKLKECEGGTIEVSKSLARQEILLTLL